MIRKFEGRIFEPLSRYACFSRGYGKWNKLSLFYPRQAKLPLLTVPSKEDALIRCGFSGSESSKFLDLLVLDVYSTNTQWMDQFLQRDRGSRNLIRYGEEFRVVGASGLDPIVTYYVPSPWLVGMQCEFLEMGKTSERGFPNDLCHLYVEKEQFPRLEWPTFALVPRSIAKNFNSAEGEQVELYGNEIDPEYALEATLSFIKDKAVVTKYLKALDSSNVLPLSKRLKQRLQNKEKIFEDLERSVINEIYETDDLTKYDKLIKSKNSVIHTIDEWSQNAHEELQNSIEPLLQNFVSKQLSLWKVYSYSESKLSLKLNEMCNITNDLNMVQDLSHIYGSLDITQRRLSIINPDYAKKQVPLLHKEINKIVYKNFFQLQFPLIAISVAGVVTGLCSVFSMGSLASLGIVLGLQRVKDSWYALLTHFQHQIREECRIGIEHNKRLLFDDWEKAYAKKESELREKAALLKQISDELT